MSARILVMRGGALGDFVLGLLALCALRDAYPEARLELIAPAAVLPLAEGMVDEAMPIERAEHAALFGDGDLPEELAGRYRYLDLAVLWLADGGGSVRRHFERLGARHILHAPALPPKDGTLHATDHLLATLNPLGIRPDESAGFSPATVTVRPSEAALERAKNLLGHLGLSPSARLLAIHPGSGGRWKCWPPERFAMVATVMRERGPKPILIQGPADEEAVAKVLEAISSDVPPVVSGIPVGDLAALLTLCAAYLGNDSGVTHLAAAAGTPTVALFGPTDPAVWGPRGPRATFLRGEEGRPESISVETVEEALAAQVSERKERRWQS